MFRLRFLLPVVFAAALCGQTSENAANPQVVIDQAIRAWQSGKVQPSNSFTLIDPRATKGVETTSQCSVPLLQAEIPKDVNFAIVKAPPPQEFRDNMPVAKALRPCPLQSK